MKKSDKQKFLYLMLAIFGAIGLSILLFFAVYRFNGIDTWVKKVVTIMTPFLYGSVMAYLLRPLCNFYEETFHKYLPRKINDMSSTLAVGLSIISGFLIVYTLIIMIAPQLYSSVVVFLFGESLSDKVAKLIKWGQDTFGENEQVIALVNRIYEAIYSEVESWTTETLLPRLGGLLGSAGLSSDVKNWTAEPLLSHLLNIISGVGFSVYNVLLFLYNLLIGIIVACYLLSSRKKLSRQFTLIIHSTFTPKWAEVIMKEITYVDRVFGGFIDGKLLDSAIIAVLCYIGCMIFRFPNALLVSAIVGITNVIPFFGPFIGAIPATFLIMLENPIKGLWFIVFVLVLQQLDGNVIGPKILGDRTGLSSFWVLFAIVLCGGLWGLVGMIVCVPVFAVLYDFIKRIVQRGLANKEKQSLWDSYKTDYPDEDKK